MQLYKEVLLSRDQHQSYVEAVKHDRLVRQVRRPARRSVRALGQAWVRMIGLFFTL
jgi:hypothetical protein